MASVLVKTMIGVIGLSFALALPAEAAKKRKHMKPSAEAASRQAPARYRNSNLFPKGPLYYSGVYMGDDPDPFIRAQIWRDVSGRFGGGDN